MSRFWAAALAIGVAGSAGGARAALMQLGVQDFSDGQIVGCFSPTLVPPCSFAWTTPTDPFNRFVGSDPDLPIAADFSSEWSFELAAGDSGPPSSARIEIGLYDHDSAAPGSQLASFVLNPGSAAARDLTALLDALLEAPGLGEQAEYNVVGIDLPQALLESLFAGGTARFALQLKGPALIRTQTSTVVAPGPNGAGLDFARLTVTYAATPEPAGALLVGLATAAVWAVRSRRR